MHFKAKKPQFPRGFLVINHYLQTNTTYGINKHMEKQVFPEMHLFPRLHKIAEALGKLSMLPQNTDLKTSEHIRSQE